jgi:hypothetical protein
MATFNLTPSQTSVPVSAMSEMNGRVPCVVEAIVDTGQTAISGVSGTVYDLINVPAGFAILSTGIEVLQADTAGNSGTVQVKVGAASQGSAVTVAATGFTASAGTMTPVVPSGSAVFVTLTVGTGTINAVIRLFVTLLDQRAKLGTGVAQGTQTNPSGQTTVKAVGPETYSPALTYVL